MKTRTMAAAENVNVPKFKNQAEADAYAANESIPLEQRIKALDEYAQAQ